MSIFCSSLYKKPTYRERIQQYVLTNILTVLARVKHNVMIKFEAKQEWIEPLPEIKHETTITSLSPIRRVKQEVDQKRRFITQPRLANWSAWDGVDNDLRIELDRLSTRLVY